MQRINKGVLVKLHLKSFRSQIYIYKKENSNLKLVKATLTLKICNSVIKKHNY